MKLKHILYIIPAVALVSSCDLDKSPLASLSPESFFSTESELQAFSNNFYTILSASFKEDSDMYALMSLPEEMRDGRSIPASGGGWTWTDLRKFNTMLDNLDKCSDEAVRSEYEGLARFFRAYFYFEKVKRFGDVPWYDTQIGSDDTEALNKPRDSRELVMQNVIADLDYAFEHLPSAKSPYRINRWAALALKSRACLFEGTYRKYHSLTLEGKSADWYLTAAADASYKFITTSPYAIFSTGDTNEDYRTLFSTDNVDGSDISKEVVLAINYNKEYSKTHSSNYTTLVSSMDRPGMTKKIVASYLCSDGTRFTDKAGWETLSFYKECQDRDPRLSQSIRTPGYHRIGQTKLLAPDLSSSITGYHMTKFVTTTDKDAYNDSDNDLFVFRAAEVYLNYAEAKAELGSITQNDIDISIKKLRDRVGMPNLDVAAANANPDPFLTNKEWGGYQNVSGANAGVILEIRRERAVELCQEGFRYWDIMRWREGKIFEQQLYGMYFPGLGEYDLDQDGTLDICLYDGEKPKSTATLIYKVDSDIILSEGTKGFVNPHKNLPGSWNEERDYLYPIPTDDRSLTGGALTQNPGWDDGLTF